MTPRYIQNRPGRKENVTAAVASAALAAGVGLFTFWIMRLFLARDAVLEPPSDQEDAGPAGG